MIVELKEEKRGEMHAEITCGLARATEDFKGRRGREEGEEKREEL